MEAIWLLVNCPIETKAAKSSKLEGACVRPVDGWKRVWASVASWADPDTDKPHLGVKERLALRERDWL
jgi:hypothetical protein